MNSHRPPFTHLTGPEPHSEAWRCTIILMHGIDGHPVDTWRSRRARVEWYDELSAAVDGLSIISFQFEYQKVADEQEREKLLEEYSRALIDTIISNSLLNRPCFFVCHSLGGILFKRALSDLFNFDREHYIRDRRLNVCGVVFLGTPHRGSPWAASFWRHMLGRPSKTTNDLMPDSRVLIDVHRRFTGTLGTFRDLAVVSVRESRPPTFGELKPALKPIERILAKIFTLPLVVPPESATLGIAQEHALSVCGTHYSVANFTHEDREKVLSLIEQIIVRVVQKNVDNLEDDWVPESIDTERYD